MSGSASAAMKAARPIMSTSHAEARRRVLHLYRAWLRELPYTIDNYTLPVTVDQAKLIVRKNFNKHRNVQDLRLIDMLIFRGQNELVETAKLWKSAHHVMYYFQEDNYTSRPTNFMGKFLDRFDP